MKNKNLIMIILFIIFIVILAFFVYTKPYINLRGNENITINVNDKYVDMGADAYNIFNNKRYIVNVENNVNYKKVGKYKVVYSTKFLVFNIKKSRIVNVVDNIAPKIELNGTNEIYIFLGDKYEEFGYTVQDNYDTEVKVSVIDNVNTLKIGTYNVDYIAIDSSKNKSVVSRKVNVIKKEDIENEYTKGVIYLTFDDGPNDKYTPIILDTLKEENVKATFFVTMKGSDAILKREYDEGHSIGLHTAYHQYNYVYSSVDNYFKDLSIVNNRVEKIIGEKSKIIRFPGGSSNTVSRRYTKGIMTSLTKEVINRGYHYFDWNISSGDAGEAHSANDVYNNVINNLDINGINMILMHDVNPNTASALKNIIRYGKEKGYRFQRITYDTKMITHKVYN